MKLEGEELLITRTELATCRSELDEMKALHDLQWRRMREATARWQKGHPEIKDVDMIWPDLGEMLFWLLEEPDRAVKAFATAIQNEISSQRTAVLYQVAHPGVAHAIDPEQILSELSFYVTGLLAGREWSKTHGG